MRVAGWILAVAGLASVSGMVGCGGAKSSSTPVTPPPVAPTTYTLTVASTDPAAGVAITASPADLNGKTGGLTGISLSYDAGTAVTLTAPASSGTTVFGSWTGCSGPSANVCAVTVSANTTVTAGYNVPVKGVAQVTVTPAAVSISIGSGEQFTATSTGRERSTRR